MKNIGESAHKHVENPSWVPKKMHYHYEKQWTNVRYYQKDYEKKCRFSFFFVLLFVQIDVLLLR
jgi:hypothetical protein